MAAPKHFKPADYGEDVDGLTNGQGKLLFRKAEITWSTPALWKKEADAPTGVGQTGCLYLILRDHHRANHRERIVYVGIASNLSPRFANHPKADRIANTRGDVYLSVGTLAFKRKVFAQQHRSWLEELEHIYIWALWTKWMLNEQKSCTLPGLGKNGGRAWHVRNNGHRFAGQLPIEIIYPWMLLKSGRDRSRKRVSAEGK